MKNSKVSKYSKLILSSLILGTLFFSTIIIAFAKTEVVLPNTKFTPKVIIKIKDQSNGINELSIRVGSPAKDLFKSDGKEFSFSFDMYDVEENSSYLFYDTYFNNDKEFYGKYFNINGLIKIVSGSFFHTQEDDDGFYDPEDPVHFKMRYDGDSNKIWIDENESGVTADDTDWDIEADTFLEKIDGKIELIIPIALKEGTDIEEKNGKKVIKGTNILSESTSAKATIIIKPEGITFDPGLETLESADSDGDSNETGGGTKSSIYKEISFDGKGLKKPSTGAYKGISQEGNLEAFIVGLTNFALSFVAAMAVIMLIYGGYLWIVDQGDDQMNEKAKKIIAGAVIGILLIISAYTIVNTIIRLEGNTYEGCDTSFQIGNGTNFDLNCTTDSGALVGAGIGGLVGGTLGGLVGGDDGALIGGLLGGVGGGVIGAP